MIDRLKNLNTSPDPETKAATAGAMVGFLGGIVFDLEYLQHPSRSFDERISKVREDMGNITQLRGDLHLVSRKNQAAVKQFINREKHQKQTKIETLIAHKPAPPSPYVETGVVLGSISLCGMAAVAIAAVVRRNSEKREIENQEEAQETVSEKASRIVDTEFERLELWLKNHQSKD